MIAGPAPRLMSPRFDDQDERDALSRWERGVPIDLKEDGLLDQLEAVPGIVIGAIPELVWCAILCVLAAAAITLTAVLP